MQITHVYQTEKNELACSFVNNTDEQVELNVLVQRVGEVEERTPGTFHAAHRVVIRRRDDGSSLFDNVVTLRLPVKLLAGTIENAHPIH